MAVNKKDYVELELLNQRLGELQQTLNIAKQQFEHSSVALDMLNALTVAKEGQELLVPIGSGTFITVNAKDVKNVKLAVGSGVVVDKPVDEAITFINIKSQQIQDFSIQTNDAYEQAVSKAMKLQEKIESDMRSK